MKGIVFTEFLELVEEKFGLKTVQEIIDSCNLATNGVYTAVGTYNHKEMFEMVEKLSELKSIPVPDLLTEYGRFFFKVLSVNYPQFMDKNDLFTFLNSIDGYIHPEVLKLYPDAELPRFTAALKGNDEMQLIYESSRKMAHFAIGLILGASAYYKEEMEVAIVKEEEGGKKVIISLQRK
ncbi:heme NO-binding domain-containing protein [Crocinitomix catalasitica]|uniref:heme NO-binding domain-containing protein n=1 Tax=Crocinitomix catalasitica TaxID=184607 RepID=UPI000489A5CF|nr:heme NO-binding domain-containing protein [Crocinitomix catalasitica]